MKPLQGHIAQYEPLRTIRRGFDDIKAGRGRDMEEVFNELHIKRFGKPLRQNKTKRNTPQSSGTQPSKVLGISDSNP